MIIDETIRKKDPWPEAISDGLSLPCSLCNNRTYFDYRINDKTWETLAPVEHRHSVICLPCLDIIANDKNVDLASNIKNIQFTGKRMTIVMMPSRIVRYEKRI